MAALFYGLPPSLLCVFAMIAGGNPNNKIADNIGMINMVICLVQLPIALGHGIRVRKEYLLRMEAMESLSKTNDVYETEVLREQISQEYKEAAPASAPISTNTVESVIPVQSAVAQVVMTPTVDTNTAISRADINTATAEELSDLPGMNEILAKRAIGLREAQGSFSSVEDFIERLGLQPHIIEQLLPAVTVIPAATPSMPTPSQAAGRVIDY